MTKLQGDNVSLMLDKIQPQLPCPNPKSIPGTRATSRSQAAWQKPCAVVVLDYRLQHWVDCSSKGGLKSGFRLSDELDVMDRHLTRRRIRNYRAAAGKWSIGIAAQITVTDKRLWRVSQGKGGISVLTVLQQPVVIVL